MIRAIRRGGHLWAIESTHYSEAVREECKKTPGMRWEGGAWCGYVDAAAAAKKRLEDRGVRVLGSIPAPILDPPTGVVIKFDGLREYQKTGAGFIVAYANTGVLLSDDMGLGKTLTTTRAVRALRQKTVVVAPSFVKGEWEKAIKGDKKASPPRPAGWPEAKYYMPTGTKPKEDIPEGIDVVIIHYDILHAWLDKILAWGAKTLVIDEAHYAQSENSRRSRCIKTLARACTYRIALTGTPMTSRPKDMWNIVDTISEARFGAKPFNYYLQHTGAFKEQVTKDKVVWNFKGASNLEELNARLAYFMLRRTTADVALELPPLTRQILDVEAPKRCVVSPAAALANDAALRKALDLAADGKLPHIIEAAVSHVEGGHSVVVFCHRKAIVKAIANGLAASGIQAEMITGDVAQAKRALIVQKQPKALIVTMDSTGVGIDFSFADVALFAELHWVPGVLRQAEKRVSRFGQTRPTLIQYFIARGSADDVIRFSVLNKMRNQEIAIGKTSDKALQDLEGAKRSPAEVLREMYQRMMAAEVAEEEEDAAQ